MEWQPIDTAPKDGKEIILRNRQGSFVAYWNHDYGEWCQKVASEYNGRWPIVVRDAKLWTALPPPPSE